MFGDHMFVLYDGAMGTMLQKSGLKPGERPDVLNVTAPESVESVHRMYVEAGSDIIVTNTFGANAKALGGTGYTPQDIIRSAVGAAKAAIASADMAKRAGSGKCVGAEVKVALDIGPLGYLLEPLGDVKYETAYGLFKEQALAGEAAGADFAAIETMSDLAEFEAALLAVVENTSLPVLATMTFDKTGYTYTGCSPESFAETAAKLGASAVGLNCSLAPEEMYATAERIKSSTDLPLIVKPNAGLPDSTTGLYSIDAAEFARQMAPFKEIGAKIIGGCCGTTPDYIRELRKVFPEP